MSNSTPNKHSRASSQKSLRIPRQLVPQKHCDSHLQAHSKRIILHHLRGCQRSPHLHTMVPANLTHDNPPPKPVPITPVQCIRRPTKTPTPTPAIIEPNCDNPVLKSRYNLRPRPRPSPSILWQGVTQPRYVAALSNLIHQEELANVVIDPTSGQALEYWHLICGPNRDTWIRALANDLGHLAQGVRTRMPTGTNTVSL